MNCDSLVCVIVPVLNQENDVEQILAGVKDQTWRPIKLFVADLGSRDETVAVVLEWFQVNRQQNFQCVLTCHQGRSKINPYQVALKHSTGTYRYQLKQGEIPDPDAIETFIQGQKRYDGLNMERRWAVYGTQNTNTCISSPLHQIK